MPERPVPVAAASQRERLREAGRKKGGERDSITDSRVFFEALVKSFPRFLADSQRRNVCMTCMKFISWFSVAVPFYLQTNFHFNTKSQHWNSGVPCRHFLWCFDSTLVFTNSALIPLRCQPFEELVLKTAAWQPSTVRCSLISDMFECGNNISKNWRSKTSSCGKYDRSKSSASEFLSS